MQASVEREIWCGVGDGVYFRAGTHLTQVHVLGVLARPLGKGMGPTLN